MNKATPRSRLAGALLFLLFASGSALLLPYATARAACRMVARATVPVDASTGLFLVHVAVDGSDEVFVLDTGAERTVIGIAAADRLHLARDEWVSTDVTGAGGRDRRRLGRPRSLVLGGVALRRHTVAADNSVVVGPIPTAVGTVPVAGLLGEDFLSPFDLDLDVPNNRLVLWDVAGCAGSFVPFKARALPAGRPVRNMLTLPTVVDGQPMTAELDSGAEATLLMAPGMRRLGLAAGGNDAVRGFGPRSVPARPVKLRLAVGGTVLPDWPALAAPIQGLRSVDMLLGADWLRRGRVWVSWSTNQVFVAEP